ncbi:hypothetical protein DFH09DRAFT_1431521 [Mycena vulgaris]|nr:hypothetical protein DFH09DRAFT_1431521 [Mycena vulgaris]
MQHQSTLVLDPGAARALAISSSSRFAFPTPTSRAQRVNPADRPAHPNATSPLAQRPFPAPASRTFTLRTLDRSAHPCTTTPVRSFPALSSRAQRRKPANRRLRRDERSAQARGLAASSAARHRLGFFVRDSRAVAVSSPRALLAQMHTRRFVLSCALPPPRRTLSTLNPLATPTRSSTAAETQHERVHLVPRALPCTPGRDSCPERG